jgi:hypothetical protein
MMPLFGLLITTKAPLYQSNREGNGKVIVAGGYMLVRRETFEQVGGYEAIRSEIVEDIEFGKLVKSFGGRTFTTGTDDLAETRMYYGFRGVWSGLSKNLYAGPHYSPARFLIAVTVLFLMGIIPVLSLMCLVVPGPASAKLLGVILPLLMYMTAVGITRNMRLPAYAAIAFPVGCALYIMIACDSLVHAYTGGPSWKGRRYAGIGPGAAADMKRGGL